MTDDYRALDFQVAREDDDWLITVKLIAGPTDDLTVVTTRKAARNLKDALKAELEKSRRVAPEEDGAAS